MRKLSFRNFPLIIFIICFLSCVHAETHYRLYSIWQRDIGNLWPLDLDGNGVDELAGMACEIQFDVRDWKLNNYYYSFPLNSVDGYSCQSLPGSHIDSLLFFITHRTKDTVFYYILPKNPILKNPSNSLKGISPFHYHKRHKETKLRLFSQKMHFIGFANCGDFNSIAIFRLNCAYDIDGLRGIVAFDTESWEIQWQYLCGPQVYDFHIFDLENDGFDEILFGSYAPYNGVTLNQTKDDSSWIFLLNSNGTCRWKHSIGSYWTGVTPNFAVFNKDTYPQIIVYQYSSRQQKESQDKLFIIDSMSGDILKTKRYGDRFVDCRLNNIDYCQDLDKDGIDEIILGNTDGYVRVLDSNLNQVSISKKYHQEIYVGFIEDLNQDHLPEVVVYSPDNHLKILDNELKEHASYSFQDQGLLFTDILRTDEDNHIFIKKGKSSILFDYQSSYVPFLNQSWNPWLVVCLIMLIPFLALWLIRKSIILDLMIPFLTKSDHVSNCLVFFKYKRLYFIGDTWADKFDLPFHGKVNIDINQNLITSENFLSILKKLSDNQIALQKFEFLNDTGEQKLIQIHLIHMSISGLYFAFISDPGLQDEVKILKQWASAAQNMAHRMKAPLNAVSMDLKDVIRSFEIKSEPDLKRLYDLVFPQAERIDMVLKFSEKFMQYTHIAESDPVPIDINTAIQENLLQLLPQKSGKVHVVWDLAENLPKVLIIQELFKFAIENVFINALQSIDGKGKIFIQTRLCETVSHRFNHWVELSIQDTGCGITVDELKRVREPFVTNKKNGTGMGLTIVQRVMDIHHGQWDIESMSGIGTVVFLRFSTV